MNFKYYIPKKIIQRPEYIKKAEPYIQKDIVKVFTGQRRVGKSYLLYQLMQQIAKQNKNANIVFVGKELPEFFNIKNEKDLFDYVKAHEKKGDNFLFIDEIQEIENFEIVLRGLLVKKKWDIWCTGSNAAFLSNDIAGKVSGRSIEIPVHGLSYQEFVRFHQLENSEETLHLYMKYGGLPYLINLELTDSVAFEYLKVIYTTILYKDVVGRENIRNTYFLESLVLFLADNTGSIVSANKISDFLKSQRVNIAPVRVLEYLKYLENAFFIIKSRRADLKGKRLLEVGEKYYFEDLGLRNSVIGFKANDITKLIENVILLHMRQQNFMVQTGTFGDKEIDFVCTRMSEKIYIQAAYLLSSEKVVSREFGNLKYVDDNYPKYVVTMDSIHFDNDNGIQHLRLREFLMMKF